MRFSVRRMLAVTGGLALGGIGAVWLANAWVSSAAAPHLYGRADEAPDRTWAIVPGARVHEDGRPYPVLADRLELARALYRAGKVRGIVVSGAEDEPAGMRRWLLDRGIPDADVKVDPLGLRTLETMRRAKHELGVHDAIVCTQRFHLARAVFLARQSGIDAVGVAADRRRYRARSRWIAREALARTRAVLDVYVR